MTSKLKNKKAKVWLNIYKLLNRLNNCIIGLLNVKKKRLAQKIVWRQYSRNSIDTFLSLSNEITSSTNLLLSSF